MLNYKYTVLDISDWDEIWFKAIIPSFPWIFVLADSVEELNSVVKISINEEIERLKSIWKNIPEEDNIINTSWKFQVRLRPVLHKRLIEISSAKNISMNQFISNILEKELVG